jgi:peptidoglycan/LPS O-acetylase OafA/YrhL
MITGGDLPFVSAALAVAALVAAGALLAATKLGASPRLAKLIGVVAFPGILLAVYVALRNPDPHGFALIAFILLALLTLPVTLLTTFLIARRLP